MADWPYQPNYDARWDNPGPPTLITRLADGSSSRRQKHANAIKTWEEEYDFDATDHDAAYAIFLAKGFITAFTKLSWDVGGTPAQERSVYFASGWSVTRSGNSRFAVSLSFELAP